MTEQSPHKPPERQPANGTQICAWHGRQHAWFDRYGNCGCRICHPPAPGCEADAPPAEAR